MRYWFTADYHLGHANIIKYCDRSFLDVEKMNNTIIHNHNERVKPDDVVFFLGDFCFRSSGSKKAIDYERMLNGKLIFIKGNHDNNNSTKTIINNLVVEYAHKRIYLVHNPEFVCIDYDINFVGHIHGLWEIQRIRKGFSFTDAINVGVDVWDFKPVLFEEIMEKRYKKWLKSQGGLK